MSKTIFIKYDNGFDNGRLCNQLVRNIALSLIAKKHNLYVDYFNYDLINNNLGINLFIGENKFNTTKIIKNNDYMKTFNSDNINYNLDLSLDYFQFKEVTDRIYKHIRLSEQQSNIIKHNPFKDRYNNNNDLYIHIRLGDLEPWNPGINYYLKVIKNTQFDKLYISTDSFDHNIITTIKTKYPETILIKKTPVETIQFGSTCKHVALTFGSFSAIIGYLSFFSDVYYSNIDRPYQAGPITLFTDKGWIPM